MRRLTLVTALLCLLTGLHAQVDNVYVYGTVKDHSSAKKMDGVVVAVYKNGAKLTEVVTNASGKYEVNLDYGSDYKLVYGKTGMVSKNITIDTRNIPEEERLGGHGMNIEMTLFSELPGVDFSILNNPIGKAKFDAKTSEVTWDLEYTNQIRNELARLLKDYDDRKKREANAEEEFAKLMVTGEAAMGAADYRKAVDSFTEALTLKANDPVAKAKLSDAQMRLTDQEGEAKLEAQYAALIKEADGALGKKSYEEARGKYQQAASVKDKEAYPKQKVKEIDVILADLAKKAEEERLAKELQEKYDAAIKAGDVALKAENYDVAKSKYGEASALKKEEQYPKDQLAAIELKLAELAKKAEEERLAKELQEKYQAAITAGDAAFKGTKYEDARAKYTEAAGLKPDEKYPKDQLAAIDVKLAELAKKAEEERLAKELQEKYQAAITAGDAAFKGAKYEDARAKYTEASGLKPDEKYPKDQLAAIDAKLAELAKKEEEERKQRELDEQYQAVITAADGAFKAASYDDAKAKYNEALGLKPAEKYPKDQLAAIDLKIAELAKKEEEERKQRELEEKYQAAIAKADAAFAADGFDEARAGYTEASKLKPAEKYPKDRLAAIDARIAELAKQAEEARKAKELEEKYQAAIAAGDAAFDGEKWQDARAKYQEASTLKAAEQYPKGRIAAIDAKLAELARIAEEERKAKELQDRYDGLIAKADKSFGADQLSEALKDYKDALQLKPAESHPKERIAAIEGRMDKAAKDKAEAERLERERKELEQRYNDAVARADVAFKAKELEKARSSYNEALGIKPDEQYPKDQLAAIDKSIADAASKDEAARLAAEREAAARAERELQEKEQRYKDMIAKADKSFTAEEYDMAKANYRDALGMKPSEQYPQDQLAEIDRLIAQKKAEEEAARMAAEGDAAERARMEEERRKKEAAAAALEAQYRELIAAADLAFGQDRLEVARGKYTEALGVKATEQYPKDKIAAIDAELERRRSAMLDADAQAEEQRRLEEERRRKEMEEAEAARLKAEEERNRLAGDKAMEERYRQIIVDADGAMAGERYQEARGLYAQALDVKPSETYPQAKIEQIDKLLAEQERLRREAELAAQRTERVEEPERTNRNTTIDIRKEEEAEQFMRDAKEREEAEKYELIKKFKQDLADQENELADQASDRRAQGIEQKQQFETGTQQLYQGSEGQRLAYADLVAQQKAAQQEAERKRREMAATNRSQAYDQKLNTEQDHQQTQLTWDDRQRQVANSAEAEKAAALQADAERARNNTKRRNDERSRVLDAEEAQGALQERGTASVDVLRQRVEDEKALRQAREEQLMNTDQKDRELTKQQLDATAVNKPKNFQDYNLSKLAQEYPQGVTEESYTEGNKVIIRRVVVNGNKADEYSKVIAKWGTFYFANGQSITEAIWQRDTELGN